MTMTPNNVRIEVITLISFISCHTTILVKILNSFQMLSSSNIDMQESGNLIEDILWWRMGGNVRKAT